MMSSNEAVQTPDGGNDKTHAVVKHTDLTARRESC